MTQRRLKILVWLLCTVLLPVQSLLPASAAIVRVSLHCVGMPAAAPACADVLVSAAEGVVSQAPHHSAMSCCRHMRLPCAMMSNPQGMMTASVGAATTAAHVTTSGIRGPSSPSGNVLPAPGCRVSVTAMAAERPAAFTTDAQGHLLLALAVLPASFSCPTLRFPQPSPAPLRTAALFPHSLCLPQAHGLRAPPAAC